MGLEKLKIEMRKGSHIAKVESFYDDGSRDEKGMVYTDLIGILSESTTGSRYLNFGELPGGYLRGAVDISNSSSFLAAIRLAPEKRILPFFGEEHIVPFPELLFLFKVISGKAIKSEVYALVYKEGESVIAHYPFGNVHDNGSICWGRTTLPHLNNIKGTEKLIGLFFGSDTNNDLYSVGTNVIQKKEFVNQKGLILEVEKRKKFPHNWLIATRVTMKNKVEQFFAEAEEGLG